MQSLLDCKAAAAAAIILIQILLLIIIEYFPLPPLSDDVYPACIRDHRSLEICLHQVRLFVHPAQCFIPQQKVAF